MHICKTYTLNFLNAKLLKTDKANLFPYALGILMTKKKFSVSIEWLIFFFWHCFDIETIDF